MHEFVTADPDLAFEMLHNKTFPENEIDQMQEL